VSLQSSQFRRASFHRDRRRRIFADESLVAAPIAGESGEMSSTAVERKSEHYGDAEFLDHQIGLIDLLVVRQLWVIGLLALLVGGLIAALVYLDFWTNEIWSAADRPAAFKLGAAGSFGAWCSCALLFIAAAMAMAIHGVRRHRIDDYDGRYRVWIWAAAGCALMSADAVAGLCEAFQLTMIRLTGTVLVGDGRIWSWFPGLILLCVVGARLAIDMWQCRLSTLTSFFSIVCYCLCAAIGGGWLSFNDGTEPAIVAAAFKLGADLLLLVSLAMHARFVLLDAEGLLPRRKSDSTHDNREDEPAEAEEETESKPPATVAATKRVDPPQSAAKPAQARTIPMTAPASPAPSSQTPVNRKLTKAEKKALQQRLTNERLKREQSQQGKW
jgi:hypothetical protein